MQVACTSRLVRLHCYQFPPPPPVDTRGITQCKPGVDTRATVDNDHSIFRTFIDKFYCRTGNIF